MTRSDDAYMEALAAWCRYHVETELYDRSISAIRDPKTGDAVIHHDPVIRSRSYAFAKSQLRLLAGLDHETSQRAKSEVTRWSFERQVKFLETR